MRSHNRKGSFIEFSIVLLLLGFIILIAPGEERNRNLAFAVMAIAVFLFLFDVVLRWVARKFIYREEKQVTINGMADGSSVPSLTDLYVSLAINTGLMFPFLLSLINPTNANFIYETSFFILIMEFIAMLSSGFAAGQNLLSRKRLIETFPKTVFWICLYVLFVGGISYARRDITIALFFLFSILGKFFGSRSYKEKIGRFAVYSIGAFFTAWVLSVTVGPFLLPFFVLPQEIIAQRPPGMGGSLTDSPQLLLMWGVLYYSILSAIQIFFYRKSVAEKSIILTP